MVMNIRDDVYRIKETFPHAIRRIDHTWIPLSDGTRLAARIWLPEDAEANPVPALLEYIPYRKNVAQLTATADVCYKSSMQFTPAVCTQTVA